MKHFMKREAGATAIEYALLAGFIAAVIASAIVSIGTSLLSIFTNVAAGFPS
jgi:pilus assembly protein Flp/PilA